MSATAGSFVMKRGMEIYMQNKPNQQVKIDVPGWFIAMLAVTSIAYFLVSFSIEYTFGRVIPTLLMVESPEDVTFDPLPTEDSDPSMIKDPEQQTPRRQNYITSSFRQTIQLLHSKGGFRARYRGLAIFIVNNIAIHMVSGFFLQFMPLGHLISRPICAIIAPVICAPLSLAWTHIVISESSPKPWYRRLPAARMWKKVAGPTAILAIAQQASVMLPLSLALDIGLGRTPDEVANLPDAEQKAIIAKTLGVLALALVFGFLLVFPANVALVRVQASLLQDTEETIVPFDRSFGGKVIPEIVGGTGRIGILDAWKTFNWSARIRLIKAYVKVIAMQVAVTLLFMVVVISQVFMIGGAHKIIRPVHGGN